MHGYNFRCSALHVPVGQFFEVFLEDADVRYKKDTFRAPEFDDGKLPPGLRCAGESDVSFILEKGPLLLPELECPRDTDLTAFDIS